jgi:hypothetical protein
MFCDVQKPSRDSLSTADTNEEHKDASSDPCTATASKGVVHKATANDKASFPDLLPVDQEAVKEDKDKVKEESVAEDAATDTAQAEKSSDEYELMSMQTDDLVSRQTDDLVSRQTEDEEQTLATYQRTPARFVLSAEVPASEGGDDVTETWLPTAGSVVAGSVVSGDSGVSSIDGWSVSSADMRWA